MNHNPWYTVSHAPAQRSIGSLQRQWETKAKSDYYHNVVQLITAPPHKTSKADIIPKTCQFILGEPTKQQIRQYGSDHFKCNDPTAPNSPYCSHHHEVCYVKPILTEDQK